MKIYTRLVLDKDDNIIEEESYEYTGPVAQCKGGGGGGGGFIGKIFKSVIDFVTGIVSVFKSPFGANFSSPDFNSTSSDNIQGILINKDSAIANIPVVYGTRMIGGIRVYVSTKSSSPASNEFLYVAFVLSEGQCEGYTSLLIDDVVVPLNSYAHGVETTAFSGAYSTENRLSVQFFDGRDDQVASTLLKDSSANWTNDHRLRGVCYIACKFRWKKVETNDDANNNPYSGLPSIKVILQGKKIMNIVSALSPPTYGAIVTKPSSWTKPTDQRVYISPGVGFLPAGGYTVTFTTSSASSQVHLDYALTQTGAEASVALTVSTAITVTNTSTSAVVASITRGPSSANAPNPLTMNISEIVSVPTGSYSVTFTTTTTSGSASASVFSMALAIEGAAAVVNVVPYADAAVSFNNNPVNVLVDYMRNPRYGKDLSNDVFDWDSFLTAARLCDQVVTYTASTTGKAFTCDAVIDTGASLMDNIKSILAGFRGMLPYQQGKFVCKIEHGGDDTDITATPANPVVVFTATNDTIVGGVTIDGDSKQTRINRCRVTYVDPSADYQPNEVIYPDEDSADDIAFMAADGVRLEKNITIGTVANREQALQYAEVFVKRSRNAKIISFATSLAGANVTVGDLVRVVNPIIGLDGVFRVSDVRINAEGDIEITGYEHQSSAYAIQAKATDIVRPTLSLPNPLLVVAPTAVTVQSGAAFNIDNGAGYLAADSASRRLFVSWTASTDPFVRDYVVQFKKSTDADYVTYAVITTTEIYIQPVTVGAIYNVRVAARNELDRRSNFATATAHTVIE